MNDSGTLASGARPFQRIASFALGAAAFLAASSSRGDDAAPNAEVAEPAAPTPGDSAEITVVGTRVAQAPGSAHVVGRRKLERFEYDDPQALLQGVPGVYARGEDGVGLRPNIGLRGTNPNRSAKVALMEDGVPFGPAPYSAPAAYYFPLMTRMYQVRVMKGPSTIVYGPQTVGGAIDLMTRPIPATGSGEVDLGFGAYGYGKFHGHYGASDGRDGFLIEGVHLRNDGFKHLPDGSDTGSYRNEWMFKASHAFDPSSPRKHELRLKLTYSEETSHETYLGLTDADFRADPLQRYATSRLDTMRWHRTAVAVTHELEPLPSMKVTTTAYRNDFQRTWRRIQGFRGAQLFDVLRSPESFDHFYGVLAGREDSTGGVAAPDALLIGPNEREFVSQGIQTVVTLASETGPLSHRIEYGFRLHYDRVERRHSEDSFLVIGGELVPEGTPTVVTAFNEASTESAALYAIDAVTFRSLTVTPGLRVEHWRSTGTEKISRRTASGSEQVVLPGVGAYLGILDELGVLAGVYRGFSPPPPPMPSANSGAAARDERDIKRPELSVNYEAGARYADAPGRVELIGFYNDYSNLTDVCTQSSGCLDGDLDRQFDAGNARIYGFEAFAEHEPELGALKFPVNVSYTLTFAEFSRSFASGDPIWGNVSAGDEVPYVPRHQVNASVGVDSKRAGGFVALTHVSAMREEAGSEPLETALATDEQLVIDTGARYRVFEPLDVYLNLRNLFNSRAIVARRPFGARPNAPRWVQLGAKLRF